MHYITIDKENDHPNIPKKVFKVREEDFSSIGKQYVLDGERVRVKSIRYRDESKMLQEQMEKPNKKFVNLEDIDEAEIQKLEYLEKMDVINEEEKVMLENIRKMRRPQKGLTQFTGEPRHQKTMNRPFYVPEEAYNQNNLSYFEPEQNCGEYYEGNYENYRNY